MSDQMSFDLDAGEQLAEKGIEKASAHRQADILDAREIALQICRERGEVTSDDVRKAFAVAGRPWLSNAAGSLFRDPRFMATGRTIRSKAMARHGNLIRVWRLAT